MKVVLKDKILELRGEGKTYKQIRKVLNCTLSVISYHCRRANLSSSNINTKCTEEEIARMNQLYDSGLTLKQVSKIVGKHRQTVGVHVLSREKRSKNISASKSVVDWRRRAKKKLVDYKGGCCKFCGYSKCVEALEFHHLDPLEKDFTISGKSWSFERLKKEVDKCILVCGNCHTEIHAGILKIAS